jgi:uncharacterized membrane protein SpoIIM required for sporulation
LLHSVISFGRNAAGFFRRSIGNNTARCNYRLGIAINVTLLAAFLLIGFYFGKPGSISPFLPKMGNRMILFKSMAAKHTFLILKNNMTVGMSLVLLAFIPLYGPLIVNWKLGFTFGLLIKSAVNGINYPSLVSAALLLPHGIPEYAAFVLMINSVVVLHVSGIRILVGHHGCWSSTVCYSFASLFLGMILLALAAVVECYVTPSVAGMLIQ